MACHPTGQWARGERRALVGGADLVWAACGQGDCPLAGIAAPLHPACAFVGGAQSPAFDISASGTCQSQLVWNGEETLRRGPEEPMPSRREETIAPKSASQGCCHQVAQTQWLKQTEMCSLPGLEARSLESRFHGPGSLQRLWGEPCCAWPAQGKVTAVHLEPQLPRSALPPSRGLPPVSLLFFL